MFRVDVDRQRLITGGRHNGSGYLPVLCVLYSMQADIPEALRCVPRLYQLAAQLDEDTCRRRCKSWMQKHRTGLDRWSS